MSNDFIRLRDKGFIKACLERDLIEPGITGAFYTVNNNNNNNYVGFYETGRLNSDKIVIYVGGSNRYIKCEEFMLKYGADYPKIIRLILFNIEEFE